MRKIIRNLYESNFIARKIIFSGLLIRNWLIPLETRLKLRFKRILGYSLNLKNPATFNEKIQWLKVNDRTPLHTICADKYAVRNHIRNKVGDKYLVPLILKTKKPDDLNPDFLPDYPFIVKTNHDSSGGLIVRNKDLIDWHKVRRDFRARLASNYDVGKGEWQYRDIPPCIIVEKLLLDKNGNIPADYKMHFFNGKLAFTQVDLDRQTDHKRNLYDPDWNMLPCSWIYKNGADVEKPKVYSEMIKIGETLAKDFIYLRVDLYVIDELIYFGELTFHSDSGNGKFIPEEWDLKLGDKLLLPISNNFT